MANEKRNRWFDPQKSTFELAVVRTFLCFVVLIVLCSYVSILFNEGLCGHFQFDVIGFSNFIFTFKFPLGVVAASIPIFALLVSNHRSVQLVRQLELQESQNLFSNHYKHREVFFEFWKELCENYFYNCESRSLAYRNLFPDSQNGGFDLSKEFLKAQEEAYDSLSDLYLSATTIGNPTPEVNDEQVFVVIKLYFELGMKLGISWKLSDDSFGSSDKLLTSALEYFSTVSRFLSEVREYKIGYGYKNISKQKIEIYSNKEWETNIVNGCHGLVKGRIGNDFLMKSEYESLFSKDVVIDA